VSVVWPNIGIRSGTKQKLVSYDDLTTSDLSLGFIKRLTEQLAREARKGLNSDISNAMLEFFHSWTDDSREYAWDTVRGYIKLVYLALEQGELVWTDTVSISKIRTRAIERGLLAQATAARAPAASSSSQHAAAKPRQTRWCADYNEGTCNHKTAHKSKHGYVSHICKFCFSQGNEYQHPESACNKVKSSKN
jgi:hypothetical protein